MKANELMIGDWIYIEHTEDGVAPYKELTQWTKEDFGFSDTFIKTHIYSVPLSPEILEKNGFKKQAFDGWEYDIRSKSGGDLVGLVLWRCDSPSPHLRIDTFTRNYGNFTSFDINYVHELQHCLKLVGIDKDIVL